MHIKLAEKLDSVNIQPYRILGACNPAFAYQTIQIEENIGLFLPCKVIIKQIDENTSEIVMVNPSILVELLKKPELATIANDVAMRFKKVLDNL